MRQKTRNTSVKTKKQDKKEQALAIAQLAFDIFQEKRHVVVMQSQSVSQSKDGKSNG